MEKNKNIITISREFGSGGRSIGKAIANELQIPYYDKELIMQVAKKTGFDPKYIEEQGEYASGKTFLSYLSAFTGRSDVMGGMSAADFLWVMQQQVILELAEKGPCVIVGRCADYILKDRSDCLHVFVHADEAFRAERIVRLYGQTEKSPKERLKDKDTRRSVNYKHFTGREWGKCQNYHLSLDSSVLGIDKCVEMIVNIVKESK
ncbi:MAG: cytidylate kinase-like family protein [bacterium]|nr:cytidylate kinase-like family protein [bacterium]